MAPHAEAGLAPHTTTTTTEDTMYATTADPAHGTTGCEACDGECRATAPRGRTLKPAPVSTRQFHYDGGSHFHAEASETNGFGRVYDDAADLGLTLVSSRTGREVVFVVTGEKRDNEGDLQSWTLAAVGAPYVMTIWND